MVACNEPLTIVLWLWNGWRPIYNFKHVNAMAGMLFDNLTIPFRLVCITDQQPRLGCDVEMIPLWDIATKFNTIPKGQPNSYVRLKLFSPWAVKEFPGQVWSIDLDAVIMQNIDSLYSDADFKINLGRSAPYNGGMWLLRTGTRTEVWDRLNSDSPHITKRRGWIGSDQAWLSHTLPQEQTWDAADGVFHYSLCKAARTAPQSCKMMFFAGSIKPWFDLTTRAMPEVALQYRRYLKQ